jgi:hypothetical protein
VKKGNDPGHSKGGWRGILSEALEVVEEVQQKLCLLHESKASVTVVTARAVLLATIITKQPDLLSRIFKDGSTFKALESYVRNWLHDVMQWSCRKVAWAAHKMPTDWQDQCEASFFQKVHVIKEFDILPSLYVNSDQTQVLYVPGDKMTWTDTLTRNSRCHMTFLGQIIELWVNKNISQKGLAE